MSVPSRRIGINPAPVGFDSPARILANAFRMTDGWGPAALDANGAPLGDCTASWLRPSNNTVGAGTYALRFTGQAAAITCNVPGSVVFGKSYDSATNRTTASVIVPGYGGDHVLTFTGTRRLPTDTTATGFTDPFLMWPIAAGSSTPHPFTEEFHRVALAAYDFDVIRVLDIQGTNNYGFTTATWDNRRKPSLLQQGSKAGPLGGMSWELLIRFCNALGAGMRALIPPAADANYALNLARLCKYGSAADGTPYTSTQSSPVNPPLNPGLRVDVAYSNEVWNSNLGSGAGPGTNGYSVLTNASFDLAASGDTSLTFTVHSDGSGTAAGRSYTAGGMDFANDFPADFARAQAIWRPRMYGLKLYGISMAFRSVFGLGQMGTAYQIVADAQDGGPADLIEPAFDWIRFNHPGESIPDVVGSVGAGFYSKPACEFFGDDDGDAVDYHGDPITLAQAARVRRDRIADPLAFGRPRTADDRGDTFPAPNAALALKYGLAEVECYEGLLSYLDSARSPFSIAVSLSDDFARPTRESIDEQFRVYAAAGLRATLIVYADCAANWSLWYEMDRYRTPRWLAVQAARADWQANPAAGTSTEPLLALPTVTDFAIAIPPGPYPPGVPVKFGIKAIGPSGGPPPISLYYCQAEAGDMQPTGVWTPPPAANADRSVLFTVTQNLYLPVTTKQFEVTLPGVPGSPPPVGDPGFERSPIAPSPGANRGTLQAPWTPAGSGTVSVVGVGDGFFGGGLDFTPAGQQCLVLGNPASTTQVIPGWDGGTYQISLMLAQVVAVSGGGNQSIRLLVDGAEVGRWKPAADRAWHPVTSSTFAATAGTHSVRLEGDGGPLDNAMVDSVALIKVSGDDDGGDPGDGGDDGDDGGGGTTPPVQAPAGIRLLLERLGVIR